jgi:hypothetical protein
LDPSLGLDTAYKRLIRLESVVSNLLTAKYTHERTTSSRKIIEKRQEFGFEYLQCKSLEQNGPYASKKTRFLTSALE